MEMAKERLDSAHILLEHHNFKDSIGRSYYAMFTAVRAILALDGVDFKKTCRCHFLLPKGIHQNRCI
ncbi:HEPN domain-containing protein [Dialister succinatiphilus]|uniref:HEPN domain-containing protein n=1 Tax=Dialister succinatiphilus TaxID=487173 RepID=UPI003AB2A0B7